MSMIFFACVVRVRDGLPLSASTDFHFNQDFLECRKRLKVLSSILAQYPSRGTAKGRDLSIHFVSSGDIACMAICSSNYSTIMAFCFLEELQWEFAASYDTTSISLASRPYAFLEFDNVIQKVKCHFNCVSSSQTKANWEKIEEELKFQPPVQLKLEDTELMNGITNGGHAGVHVEVGKLLLHTGDSRLPEPNFANDRKTCNSSRSFCTEKYMYHCYLYLFYSSARKVKTFVLFFSVCLCNIYLYGLRNLWQIAFHIGVASLSSYQILTRQLMEKQPDCGV
uniref:SEC22 homolog C, vesicle trafficking protein n=1 Tax=Strix occidentalis caurina TaxID=311401 RepID=A0A8D0F2X1_STROC